MDCQRLAEIDSRNMISHPFVFHERRAGAWLVDEEEQGYLKRLHTAEDERVGEKLQICLFTLFII